MICSSCGLVITDAYAHWLKHCILQAESNGKAHSNGKYNANWKRGGG